MRNENSLKSSGAEDRSHQDWPGVGEAIQQSFSTAFADCSVCGCANLPFEYRAVAAKFVVAQMEFRARKKPAGEGRASWTSTASLTAELQNQRILKKIEPKMLV